MEQLTHAQARELFRTGVDKRRRWEEEAVEDYKFRAGDQWTSGDRQKLAADGRPCVTVNITKAYTNLLSGYQRLNRYDAQFLPRTREDLERAKLRGAVSKFVLDQAEYDVHEAVAFLHCITGGLGILDVGYRVQPDSLDGDIYIEAGSPFNYYPDPDSRKPDWSDARWIAKAWWADKEPLKEAYPEHAEAIEGAYMEYDLDESLGANLTAFGPVWWDKTTKKARIVEMWYKVYGSQTYYKLQNGQVIRKEEADANALFYVVSSATVPSISIRVKVMLGNLELEDKPSPYEHGMLPFIPIPCDSLLEAEAIPAGIVRDMKDMQRSINKQHSQQLHLINTNAGQQWQAPASDKMQLEDLRENGARPNAIIRYQSADQKANKVIAPSIDPGLAQIEQQSLNYVEHITGVNKAMMGMPSPTATSGRAKEIDQKQAITNVAPLFDNLRAAKKTLFKMLWGDKNKKGLIPQYYRDERVIRIVGDDGQDDFVAINRRMPQLTPWGYVEQVVNDVSVGEYDIVITDTPATPTQRQAQFWALVDAANKLGIPGELIFDILLDASDLPQREQIKQRWQERQQQAQMQAQAAAQQQALAARGVPPEAFAQPDRAMTRNRMAQAM
jgi:hypothetical protein